MDPVKVSRVRTQLRARGHGAMISDEDIVQALVNNDEHVGRALQALELQAQAMAQLNAEAVEATAMADAVYPGAPPVPGSYPSASSTYMAYPVAAASRVQKQWRSRGNLYPDAPRGADAPTGPAGFPLPIATAQPIPGASQQLSIATAVGTPVAAAPAGPLGGSIKPRVWGVHPDKACDMSEQDPIVGWRYHRRGTDYDLSESWFDRLQPHEKLAFVKIAPPGFAPDLAPGELFFDVHRAKPSYIPFDEYVRRDGSGRLVLTTVTEACMRAGVWEGYAGCPVVRVQALESDEGLPITRRELSITVDGGASAEEVDALLHGARLLRLVLDTSAVPTLNGHGARVAEMSRGGGGGRGPSNRKPLSIYPCFGGAEHPLYVLGDVQRARTVEGQRLCTSCIGLFAVLTALVFFVLCYPEWRRNTVFLPAKCEPYADAALYPEVRPYRHCYQQCLGCFRSVYAAPCAFKLGMHYRINEYDLESMWFIAGGCAGGYCCQRKVCQTCRRTEQRCSRRRSRRLRQAADDAFAANGGGGGEYEDEEEDELIASWGEEVIGDWEEAEGGEMDEEDEEDEERGLDFIGDGINDGIGDGSERDTSRAASTGTAGEEEAEQLLLPTWRAAADGTWKAGADAHRDPAGSSASPARRLVSRQLRTSSRSSSRSSSSSCYTTTVSYSCNCRCVAPVYSQACQVRCLPYWRALVPIRVSVDRYEQQGVFYADDDPRSVAVAKAEWRAMLSTNGSTAAERATGNGRENALAAIEGDDGFDVYSPYADMDMDTATRSGGDGALGLHAAAVTTERRRRSVNMGWSRLVTLVYDEGPSRDGAMYQLSRPEHVVGTVQECFYDPQWDTRTNVLPHQQVAFLSEMGYSAWKWTLLLLVLVPLLMMCATCGYARFLGVERVVAVGPTVLL